MARRLRLEYAGAIYHVTVRSNTAAALLRDDKDRDYWLYRVGESAEQHAVRVYLYCLMTNHFHLLVETPQGNLNRFMHSILTGYTVYYNRRHRTHGHVTQGRYSAKLVSGDEYLLKLSRYVPLNPVKIKSVAGQDLETRLQSLRHYAWSSHRAYTGVVKGPDWLVMEPLLRLVGGRGKDRAQRNRDYVEAGVAREDEEIQEALTRSVHCVGDEEYREWVEEQYEVAIKACRRPEDAGFRQAGRMKIEPDLVLQAVATAWGEGVADLRRRRRCTGLKAMAGWLLGRYAGLTQRESAPLLGMTAGASMSYHIRRLPRLMEQNPKIRKCLGTAESILRKNTAFDR